MTSMNYFDSDMYSINAVVDCEEKGVVYIYAFGKGRTQFILRMFHVLSNSYL